MKRILKEISPVRADPVLNEIKLSSQFAFASKSSNA